MIDHCLWSVLGRHVAFFCLLVLLTKRFSAISLLLSAISTEPSYHERIFWKVHITHAREEMIRKTVFFSANFKGFALIMTISYLLMVVRPILVLPFRCLALPIHCQTSAVFNSYIIGGEKWCFSASLRQTSLVVFGVLSEFCCHRTPER